VEGKTWKVQQAEVVVVPGDIVWVYTEVGWACKLVLPPEVGVKLGCYSGHTNVMHDDGTRAHTEWLDDGVGGR
jgi:hypothetical protein